MPHLGHGIKMALLKVQPLGYQFKLTARIGPGRRVVGHICVGVVAGGSCCSGPDRVDGEESAHIG